MQNDIWKIKVISTYTVHIFIVIVLKKKITSINAQPKFKTLLRESLYLQISIH